MSDRLMGIAPDPLLNCAAEICCNEQQAFQARVELLCKCGCPDELAPKVARRMKELGIALTSTNLTEAIREIAFPKT